MFASAAQADTLTVTSATDDTAAAPCTGSSPNWTCTTLRDALGHANSDTSADTIVFQNGVSGTITLSTAGALPLANTHGITIQGPGSGALAVDAHNASQAFAISGTNSSSPGDAINGLTVENGKTSSPGGAIGDSSSRALSLSGDVIKDSTTTATNDYGGGGVYSDDALTVANTMISGNTATGTFSHGGGIDVKNALYVSNSTLSGNSAKDDGAIGTTATSNKYVNNLVSVTNSKITGNHANGSQGYGGGIGGVQLQLTVSGSTISNNTAPYGGGISAEPKYGASITNTVVTGNSASGGGGGIGVEEIPAKYSAFSLKNSTVSGNQATLGAGVYLYNVSTNAKIEASTISGNQGGANSFGGGIDVHGKVEGPVDVIDSTVSGNSAANGGGVSIGDSHHEKVLGKYSGSGNSSTNRAGAITLENSTIASNAASSGSGGGGIYLGFYQYNSSSPKNSATADITSTVVSGNTSGGAAQDLARSPSSTSGGFNGAFSLIQAPGSAPLLSKNQVILGANPQLGALANNGGPTQTMLPSGTSPLIDQGHSANGLATDQRGLPRTVDTSIPNPPGGDGTDIGAVELPSSSVVGIGFGVTINGEQLGGHKRLLIAGSFSPVKCQVKASVIASCVIQVKVHNKLVATGASSTNHPGRSLTVRLTPTSAGVSMLKHHRLGLKGSAFAVGGTPGQPATLSGNVQLLGGPSFTLQGSSSAKLSGKVRRELDQIASLLTGVAKVKCTAFTNPSVAGAQAKAACKRLKHDGLKAKYKSSGKSASGGKRRLVISFKF